MKSIIKALSLMSFQDSYNVAVRNPLFQNELNWLFLKTGIHPTDALFISYAYKGDNYPAYFQQVSEIFAKAGIRLTDINSGDPAGLIAASRLIVVGGGDIATFISRMNSLKSAVFDPYAAIRDRIANGVPYIGWNEGSAIASPKYFVPPASAVNTGINASPFQIICNYRNSAQNKTAIFNFLNANPGIKKVIAEVDQLRPDGTSARLEDTGGGIIDSPTQPYPIIIRFKIVDGVLVED